MNARLLLMLTALLLTLANASAEHAIYKLVDHWTTIGEGKTMRFVRRGFWVFELDLKKATAIYGFSVEGEKIVAIQPLHNYRIETVSGPRGSTHLILAKAENHGALPTGVLLESVYQRGKNSTVTVGLNGPRQLPRLFASTARVFAKSSINGQPGIIERSGKLVLDLEASIASNDAGETFDATVTRLAGLITASSHALSVEE
jgi:hypothetical protein